MEEREMKIPQELVSIEAASAALVRAASSTQKVLKNELPGEQEDFYTGLLENLQGARVWLDTKITRRKFLILTAELALTTTFLTSCAPVVAESVIPIDNKDGHITSTEVSTINGFAHTEAPTQLSTTLPSVEPTTYHVEAAGGSYTETQLALNESQSAKDQETHTQRWLDYWINFDNRPFAPDTTEISWKYIYDNPSNPKEVMVMIEAGGEYAGKLFTVPLANGRFADYPPKVQGDNIEINFGPLELSSGGRDQWLSVKNGIPVRKDVNSDVTAELDMETGQWLIYSYEQVQDFRNTKEQFDKFGLTPDQYTLSYDTNGVLTGIDHLSGEKVFDGGKWIFNDSLKGYLSGSLEKTRLKPINGERKGPSGAVDAYTNKIFHKIYDKNPEILAQLVDGLAEGERFASKSCFLYEFTDGTYAWGLILGKSNKTTSWIASERFLFYQTTNNKVEWIPIDISIASIKH